MRYISLGAFLRLIIPISIGAAIGSFICIILPLALIGFVICGSGRCDNSPINDFLNRNFTYVAGAIVLIPVLLCLATTYLGKTGAHVLNQSLILVSWLANGWLLLSLVGRLATTSPYAIIRPTLPQVGIMAAGIVVLFILNVIATQESKKIMQSYRATGSISA